MYDPFPQTQQESFFGPNQIRLGSESPAYQQMFDAVTMKPGGTPLYQQMGPNFQRDYSVFNSYDKAGDTGDQGEQIRMLLEKRNAYRAMSPADQQQARTTGAGYFNNADSIHLFDLLNNQSNAISSKFNQLYGDQLQAGTNAILNNEGFTPNMKSWAALNQGNKTFSSMNVGNPLMKSQLPLGNQLGNIVNRWKFAGVDPGEMLNNFANTRDSIMDEVTPFGGWQLQGYGYNSQGMGAGQGTGGETGWDTGNDGTIKAGLWGNSTGRVPLGPGGPQISSNQAWGNGVGYQMGWHAPKPFANNSLLGSGGNGIASTGTTGRPTAPNINGPNGGSWSSPTSPWNVLPGIYGSPQNASGGYWGGPLASNQLPPWQNGGDLLKKFAQEHSPGVGAPGDLGYNPNTQWYQQQGNDGAPQPPAPPGAPRPPDPKMKTPTPAPLPPVSGANNTDVFGTDTGYSPQWNSGIGNPKQPSSGGMLPWWNMTTNGFDAGQIDGQLLSGGLAAEPGGFVAPQWMKDTKNAVGDAWNWFQQPDVQKLWNQYQDINIGPLTGPVMGAVNDLAPAFANDWNRGMGMFDTGTPGGFVQQSFNTQFMPWWRTTAMPAINQFTGGLFD